MSVKLLELELRPCALVDGVGFVWSEGRWKSPSDAFTSKLTWEGVAFSEEKFRAEFPEADLDKLPTSSRVARGEDSQSLTNPQAGFPAGYGREIHRVSRAISKIGVRHLTDKTP